MCVCSCFFVFIFFFLRSTRIQIIDSFSSVLGMMRLLIFNELDKKEMFSRAWTLWPERDLSDSELRHFFFFFFFSALLDYIIQSLKFVLERFSAPRGMKNHGTICLFFPLTFPYCVCFCALVARVVQPNASVGISQAPTSGRYACYLYTIPFFYYQFSVKYFEIHGYLITTNQRWVVFLKSFI